MLSTPTIIASLPATDIPNSLPDAAPLSIGQSLYGVLGTGGDADVYRVTLVAGQTYDFRLLGVGTAPVADPFLALYDSNAVLLASNDDAANTVFGTNSSLTFTASTSGSFYLQASSFDVTDTGTFLITAVNHNPAGVVLTNREIAWQLTNNSANFFAGATSNIPAQHFDLSADTNMTFNISALTAAGQSLAVAALGMWADILSVNFTQTGGTADIMFDDSDADATAYCTSTLAAGDKSIITQSQVMITTGWLNSFGTTLDCYSFETYVHEIGHAFGLGHGGNYNGSAEYGTDNYYLNDSQHLSIMSYMQSIDDEFTTTFNNFINARFRYVVTPMVDDILAIQSIYGLSTTTRTGATTYGYNSNTGNFVLDNVVNINDPLGHNFVAFTIFDNGGSDTVDMSGFTGAQRIDLREGASSDVLGGKLNMGISFGTQIENARGGGGADTLIGNTLANLLVGNGSGDVLNGGAGADSMFGGAGSDTYVVDQSGDKVFETLNTASTTDAGGTDTVQSAVSFRLDTSVGVSFVENLTLIGTGNTAAAGNALANRLVGNGANNTLSGLGGADIMQGGAGNDTYVVENSGDQVFETTVIGGATNAGGIDTILSSVSFRLDSTVGLSFVESLVLGGTAPISAIGNALSNTLTGNAGNNAINGLAGSDVMIGGAGDDTYFVDNVLDKVFETTTVSGSLDAGGRDMVQSSVSFSLDAYTGVRFVENLALTGLANIDALGNALANALFGNAGNNLLAGGLGNDALIGGGGSDIFLFATAAGVGNIDRVQDFSAPLDTIRLDDAVFAGLALGTLGVSAFVSNISGTAGDGDDRVIYDTDSGALFFDSDGTGIASAIQFATLTAGLALTNADFVVV